MHAGLLFVVVVVVVVVGGVVGVAGLTSSRALGSTVTLLRTNGHTSMGVGSQAM